MGDIYLPDHVVARLLPEIDRAISRSRYEDTLVAIQLYPYAILREDPDYYKLNKRELIARTLNEKGSHGLLVALDEGGAITDEARRILKNAGIELGRSLAGEITEPAREISLLEVKLAEHGYEDVMRFLEQSLDNYVREDYEASNAMSRTALETIVQHIAEHLAQIRGGETIPRRGNYLSPADYRGYLETVGFLDQQEKQLLDKFYGYASTDGSHPGISTEAESRLRKLVVVGICLLYIEKLDNQQFMDSLL